MRQTSIHSNDKLTENDGIFAYTDSYGERTEIGDIHALYSWAAQEGVDIDDTLEKWIYAGACEQCAENKILTDATEKVRAANPFGSGGERWVALCDECAAVWRDFENRRRADITHDANRMAAKISEMPTESRRGEVCSIISQLGGPEWLSWDDDKKEFTWETV